MVLEVEAVRVGRIAPDLVDALPELDIGIGQEHRPDAPVARPPGRSAIVRSVHTRDRHRQGVGVPGIDQDRVQAQAATAGEPLRPVVPQPLHELEASPAVAAAEQAAGSTPA